MTRSNNAAEQVKEQALAWFVRINSGDATAAERQDHGHWLEAHPDHQTEYAKLGAIWSDLDRIADPRSNALCLEKTRPETPPRRHLGRRGFLAGGALAAGVAGLAGLNGIPYWLSDYATATGEQRTVSLSDGSVVTLDADSAIALAYDDRVRCIRLLQGRAFFDVAKDTGRPFIVEAANGSATAHGTRFVVHQWADTVTVSVEESTVSVVAPDSSRVVLQAGEYVSYALKGIGEVESGDVEAATAWRRGKLIFEDRPLRQVIADANRYRSGTIRIMDSALLDLRVSGIFDITNPDGVLDAITSGLPVQALHLSRYLVLLRPA